METTIKKTAVNSVMLEGYLKETTLELKRTASGRDSIQGQIIVAVSDTEDYRARFISMKTNAQGMPVKNYDTLCGFLPNNVISISSLLQANPSSKFDTVKDQATKIYIYGSFETYDKKDERGVITTTVTIRGQKCGIKSEQKPFNPHARFEVNGYVDGIKDEREKNSGEPTGRKLLNLLVPDYFNEVVYPIDFICENEVSINSINNYSRGDSGFFVGSLKNIKEEEVVSTTTRQMASGGDYTKNKKAYSFINERIIDDMESSPFSLENSEYISAEEVKKFSANRVSKLEALEVTATKTDSYGHGPMGSEAAKAASDFAL